MLLASRPEPEAECAAWTKAADLLKEGTLHTMQARGSESSRNISNIQNESNMHQEHVTIRVVVLYCGRGRHTSRSSSSGSSSSSTSRSNPNTNKL